MRLDEDKFEELRGWGQALRQAEGEELAAAGRAILMLIEEVERLRLELRRTREQMSLEVAASSSGAASDLEPEQPSSTLHQRLHRVLRRDPEALPDPSPEPMEAVGPDLESDAKTVSPQEWIESLRRQT